MATTEPIETAALVDVDAWPNPRLPGPRPAPPPDDAPAFWYLIRPPLRARICRVALDVLAAHPDRTQPGSRAWLAARCRERIRAQQAAGDPVAKAVEAALAAPNLASSFVYEGVVAKLLEAGSVLDSLKAQRARLDAEIAKVEALTAGGAR